MSVHTMTDSQDITIKLDGNKLTKKINFEIPWETAFNKLLPDDIHTLTFHDVIQYNTNNDNDAVDFNTVPTPPVSVLVKRIETVVDEIINSNQGNSFLQHAHDVVTT